MNSFQVYSLAIGANLTFSTASMIFSYFARRFSPTWINQVKVSVAFLCFIVAAIFSGSFNLPASSALVLLLMSGLAGLCAGDIFLFRAYASLGAGRSLVLFSFQPLMLGLYGYFVLGQLFTTHQFFAVICMLLCIFIFMFERSKLTGAWDLKSFFWAFVGISLDACGVMLTRTAYEASQEMGTFEVNVIRCFGALVGFFLIRPKSYGEVLVGVKTLLVKEKVMLIGASIGGCFISLALYLAALKHAHVGTLTAISITGPVWVSMLECLYQRKLPNIYLSIAFIFFLSGFYLMVAV